MKQQNNPNGSFDWQNSLIDAGILSVLTFFTTLGGLGATGQVGARELIASGIAGAIQFFTILAIKRGLYKKEK